MPKNKIRIMTGTAMLTAFSVILERFLPLVNTDTLRVSLGNVPIIMSSIFFGPVAGALCGVLSDIIGCFLNGYPPVPLLTLAPLTVGLLPGISAKIFKNVNGNGISNIFVLSGTLIVTNLLASAFITTMGLHVLYGSPFPFLLAQRIPVTLINTAVEILILFLILRNGTLHRLFGIKKQEKNNVHRNDT